MRRVVTIRKMMTFEIRHEGLACSENCEHLDPPKGADGGGGYHCLIWENSLYSYRPYVVDRMSKEIRVVRCRQCLKKVKEEKKCEKI